MCTFLHKLPSKSASLYMYIESPVPKNYSLGGWLENAVTVSICESSSEANCWLLIDFHRDTLLGPKPPMMSNQGVKFRICDGGVISVIILTVFCILLRASSLKWSRYHRKVPHWPGMKYPRKGRYLTWLGYPRYHDKDTAETCQAPKIAIQRFFSFSNIMSYVKGYGGLRIVYCTNFLYPASGPPIDAHDDCCQQSFDYI